MGVEDIGNGIKTNLETISALKAIFAPKELPDSLPSVFPMALILPGVTTYDIDFSGNCNYNFRIIVFFSPADKPTALNTLLDYIEPAGTNSVKAAIEGDITLDSSADTCMLRRNLGFGMTLWGNTAYVTTEFELEVWG